MKTVYKWRMLVLLLVCSVLTVGGASGEDAVIAEVLGREIRHSEREALSDIIMSALIADYTQVRGIRATDADIAAFVAASRRNESARRREWRESQSQIRAQLASTGLVENVRQELNQRLEMLDRFLETDRQTVEYLREHPEAIDTFDREIAERFIRAWKVNAALFAEYGGRVIFQQAGPEPLDAYRQFLEAREAAGDLRILDTRLRAAFWEYFVDASMHSIIARTPEEGAAVFETPWWLRADQEPIPASDRSR